MLRPRDARKDAYILTATEQSPPVVADGRRAPSRVSRRGLGTSLIACLMALWLAPSADAKLSVGIKASRSDQTVTLVVKTTRGARCLVSAPTGRSAKTVKLTADRSGRARTSVRLDNPSPPGGYVYRVSCRLKSKRGQSQAQITIGVGGKPTAPVPPGDTPAPLGTDPDRQISGQILDEGKPADEGYGGGEPYNDGQCTRYAWRKRQDLPGNLGNANTWDDRAAAQGFPVDRSPRAGDIAVWEAYSNGTSWAGHVAYVEGVNAGNTITISEWNWRGPYITSVRTISPAGLKFIHRKGSAPAPAPAPTPPAPLRASVSAAFPMDANGVVSITQDDRVQVGFNVDWSESFRPSFVLRPESGPIYQLLRAPGDRPTSGDWLGDGQRGYYRADLVAPPTLTGDFFMRWNAIDSATGRFAGVQPSFVARIYPAARFDGPGEATITSDRQLVALRVTNQSGRVWQRGLDNLHFVDPNNNDLTYPYCPGEPRWLNGNAVQMEETGIGRGQTATYLVPVCRTSYRGDATLRFNFVREGVAHYSPAFALRLHIV